MVVDGRHMPGAAAFSRRLRGAAPWRIVRGRQEGLQALLWRRPVFGGVAQRLRAPF